MQDLGWRRRWGSCPAARRGARQRAGLTPASASNTLSCLLEMLHSKQLRSIKMLIDSNHGIYREQIYDVWLRSALSLIATAQQTSRKVGSGPKAEIAGDILAPGEWLGSSLIPRAYPLIAAAIYRSAFPNGVINVERKPRTSASPPIPDILLRRVAPRSNRLTRDEARRGWR